ncbi:MAG: hypothetical protein JXA96_17250 [Sedimentisphaerales bacterium]|nr:hypothetical protein [Sedimentisphaerales bacterium]
MEFIKINNFEKFQHYKDRRPTWIKLLTEIIDQFDAEGNPKKYYILPDTAKNTFLHLLCLRANYIDKIPYPNDKWLKKRLGLSRISLQPLVVVGFISIDSNSVSKPYQSVSKPYQDDTEVVRQRERESKSKRERESKRQFLEFVFLTDEENKKLIERYGDYNTHKLIDSLNRYIGSKGVKYKSHYFTILNFAKRDNIPELETPDQKKASEAEQFEKLKQELRKEDGQFYRERTTDELQAMLKDKNHITRRWLIKEILEER